MKCIATIGTFDGVHKGHLYLLETLCREAGQRGLEPVVIVIDKPHSQRLTTPEEQDALLKKYKIHIANYKLDDVRHLTALDFLNLLQRDYNVTTLLMGYDHRFGADQLDYKQLSAVSCQLAVISCPQGPEVSSSKIREALLAGDLAAANDMLGYDYTLSGSVVHGNAIGRTIGFPTANIQMDPCKLIPRSGVYAAITQNPSSLTALVNIGTNPTVGNDHVSVEAYMPDYQGPDFYGQYLTLQLVRRLRDEQFFASLDQLKQQIQSDLRAL